MMKRKIPWIERVVNSHEHLPIAPLSQITHANNRTGNRSTISVLVIVMLCAVFSYINPMYFSGGYLLSSVFFAEVINKGR